MKILPLSFYLRPDVVVIAQELLGKIIVSNQKGIITYGRIVETEAYNGITDKASHAYNGRRTRRNEMMYAPGGVAYIYLCYGIHHLLNVVTNKKNIPHAILIRAAEPLHGLGSMLQRTGKENAGYSLTSGPGNVSKALGVHMAQNGISLQSQELYLADDGFSIPEQAIGSSPRIGVSYAGSDALLPYRFFLKGNPYVSGPKKGRVPISR